MDPAAHAAVAVTVAPGNAQHFGAAIDPGLPSIHLAQIASTPQRFNGQTLRVEGQITAVCQHMGCWMEIRDEASQAHVRMHGHAFFLPRDVSGHRAAVAATIVSAAGSTECDGPGHGEHGAPAAVAQIELDALGVDVFN